MFFLENASGHDFEFHVASWLDVAGQWREGILYPRWAEWANWGYGEPRFIFYPPASWILGAALTSSLPVPVAPMAYIWLTLVAAGMAMWRLARDWLSPPQAVATAVFFAVNPYNLLLAYYRSDFAELLAAALFPLLILATLRVAREGWRGVPLLALVFGAIWLCNAPAAVIASYSLALLLAVSAAQTRSLRTLLAGATGMATGFGLAAFYILPAAWERRWVQVTQAITGNLRPERNFIFTSGGDPEFVLFNWKVSSLALGLMLITGVLCVFTARRRRDFPQLWWTLLALALASTILMFSPSAILWRLLPELRFVQFPWRWLDALAVPFAFFAAAAAGRSRRQWTLWIAVLVLLGATGTAIASGTWWDTDDFATLTQWVHSGLGYEGTDEYTPIGCDRYQLPGVSPDSEESPSEPIPLLAQVGPDLKRSVPLRDVELHVETWTAERRIVSVNSAVPLALALRLVDYPAWSARIDDRNAAIERLPETAEVVLRLPAGPHQLDLSFRRTWDRTAGGAISIVCTVALLAFEWRSRRRQV
ncbi:MAG TPA: 6-pyruvoyl-tetrahydropterin synthase-related protein [Candidatus Acidoferrum sp.]|nr:6-pyruvoyl-tetrahydropterin synthase-related protein [Candidatus Acidoferrum sp.]